MGAFVPEIWGDFDGFVRKVADLFFLDKAFIFIF